MYGISRFSKKSFTALCEEQAQACLGFIKRENDSLDDINSLEWTDRLSLGRAYVLNRLKEEANKGLIANENNRFTETALVERMLNWMDVLQKRHGFDRNNGYAQVKGKDIEVIKAYVIYNSLRSIIQDCAN